MPHWIAVATLSECPPGTALEVVAGERIVAVFNVEGTIYAVDGVCPHQGGPLGKGTLTGNVVTCPWHGWQFNVCTGQHELNAKIALGLLPVRVERETILIDCHPDDNGSRSIE